MLKKPAKIEDEHEDEHEAEKQVSDFSDRL
jgi:hypothetical protein